MAIFDAYVHEAPSPQVAVDIFRGAWASAFPPPFEGLRAGNMLKPDDPRLPWAAEQMGGLAGRSALELGPLEGTMTWQLEQLGAASVVAVEANTTAYLRCLIAKEILGLQRARLLCGDFLPFLRTDPGRFDVCVASGVLYHMRNPAELIALVARAADQAFFWTHYYDEALVAANPNTASRFAAAPEAAEYLGFRHARYRQQYQGEVGWSGFCGGSAPDSAWLNRADLLACLRHFGYDQLTLGFDDPGHFGGPSLAIVAVRSDPAARPRFDAYAAAEPEPPPSPPAPTPAPAATTLQQLGERDAYIARVEAALGVKNAHIASLEQQLARVERGRVLRLLRRLGL